MILLASIFVIFLSTSLVSAECNLDASLINQDPYPAIPGDYVKLVFQLEGIEDASCGVVKFELLENYPITFDPGISHTTIVRGGTYQRDYNSYLSIPYRIRIDSDALDGETPIEVRYSSGQENPLFKNLETFYLEIEDAKADFEIHVDKYSYMTKELTIEILNIAKSDVEALTLEIPNQEGVNIIGTNRVIVGDLDSNEYTIADFKADLNSNEITINVFYSDSTGARRSVVKNVNFDSTLFESTADSNGSSTIYIIIIIVIIALVIWWFYRRRKKKQHKHHRAH